MKRSEFRSRWPEDREIYDKRIRQAVEELMEREQLNRMTEDLLLAGSREEPRQGRIAAWLDRNLPWIVACLVAFGLGYVWRMMSMR